LSANSHFFLLSLTILLRTSMSLDVLQGRRSPRQARAWRHRNYLFPTCTSPRSLPFHRP
jgi:hypothetical protein